MARNIGIMEVQGTLGNLTFYKMDGKNIVRRKTSLDKKRVNTDPAFANSRKSAAVFGVAAFIAKEVYWTLPKEKRKHGLIGKLTGMANKMLHEGKSAEEVRTKMCGLAELKREQ
jgi:hypothetical protein